MKKTNMEDKKIKRKKTRALIIVSIFVAITVGLILFLLFSPQFSDLRTGLLEEKELSDKLVEVTYLYVGQGDATLIRDVRDGGKVMLIDGGPSPEVEEYVSGISKENRAKTTIGPYLEEKGIDKIDYLVESHKHGDHLGGFTYILNNFEVDTYYNNGTVHTSSAAEKVYNLLDQKTDVKVKTAGAGDVIPFGDEITCQVLGPLRKYENTAADENNNSLVLRLTANNVSFLFPGDAQIVSELDLTSYGPGLQTTIMKVPHHGSTSSSSWPFLDLVQPKAAVFSCGRNNPYGFPSFKIMRRYENLGAEIYRTDLDGSITAVTDGNTYQFSTQR
ncbi:MAG: ComEC/Rec2 family competence protein [Elusimicrobiota bacterium]